MVKLRKKQVKNENYLMLYRDMIQHASIFASVNPIVYLTRRDYGSKKEVFHGLPFGRS